VPTVERSDGRQNEQATEHEIPGRSSADHEELVMTVLLCRQAGAEGDV
jgi:hypothetical protein